MSFNCRVCNAYHYSDTYQSRRCECCNQWFCFNHTPVPNDRTFRTCGRQTSAGWKCNKCDSNPPLCTYNAECKNELVEGEYTPCKACMRPMCGDHMQTVEICEECWNAGRRIPFINAALQKKGWNVKE